MSTKNPFEIRLEVLKMAREMLETSYVESSKLAWDMVSRIAEYQNKHITELEAYYDTIKPKMYSAQDIIAKATELYDFINTATGTKTKKDKVSE